jgi:hypothetical protein
MKLRNLGYVNLSRYEDLEIEDVPAFFALAFHLIGATDSVVYTVARARGKAAVDVDTVGEALGLIQTGARGEARLEGEISFPEAPAQAFMNSGMVRDVARAPLAHDDQAVELLAKYVNFHLNNLLLAGARAAQRDNLEQIKQRHLLPHCEAWPFPLNRHG